MFLRLWTENQVEDVADLALNKNAQLRNVVIAPRKKQ